MTEKIVHGKNCDCRTKIACEDAEEAELHGTVRGVPIAPRAPSSANESADSPVKKYDLIEQWFYEELAGAECRIYLDPNNENDEGIEVEYGLGTADTSGRKLYFHAKECATPPALSARPNEADSLPDDKRTIRRLNYLLWMTERGGCRPTPDWDEGFHEGVKYAEQWRAKNEADAPRGQAVASDRERGIWRAAITLANNICVQESDDHNADDQIRECNATAHCAKRIREYVEPEDEMLDELLREAHVPPPSPVGEADGMREWQPIETAPTDETMFLAGWPDGRMAVLKGSILAAQKGRATPTPEHLQFQCTHWQPLPEPPK